MDNPVAVTQGRIKLIPYFRFIWGAKEAMRGNWYLGLVGFHTKGYPRELWIYFSVRGLLRWTGGTLVVSYFLGAAIIAYIFSRNPYNRITYADLVLPTRWSSLRVMRGQTLIDDGLNQLRKKHYGPAFMLLNHGLQLDPSNLPARMIVGQFYTGAGYLNRAMQLYRQGIPYATGQTRFIANAIKLAEYQEDYALVLTLVEEAEAVTPESAGALRRLLRDKRILALEKLGRYEELITLWQKSQGGEPSMTLNAAWARAWSATGHGTEAIAAVEKDPSKFGLLREPWELLLDLAKENHRPELGRKAIEEMIALEPTRYRFYVKRIAYVSEIGTQSEALSLVDDYFLRFGADPVAVALLLKGVENDPTQALVEHIWREAQAVGQAGPAAHMAYVQNLMRLGDLELAQQEFTLVRREIERTSYRDDGWIEGTEALLELMRSDSPSSRSLLQNYSVNRLLPPAAFRTMIDALLRSGRQEAAHEIALLARNRYPAIRDITPAALEVRNPEILIAIASKPRDAEVVIPLIEARQELAALHTSMQTGQWDLALSHIGNIEKSPLAKELGDQLLYHRITIHGYLSNQTEISLYLRRLLASDRLDVARLRALANELYAAGYSNSAVTILREILRKHADAKWASNQLEVWAAEIRTAPLSNNTIGAINAK